MIRKTSLLITTLMITLKTAQAVSIGCWWVDQPETPEIGGITLYGAISETAKTYFSDTNGSYGVYQNGDIVVSKNGAEVKTVDITIGKEGSFRYFSKTNPKKIYKYLSAQIQNSTVADEDLSKTFINIGYLEPQTQTKLTLHYTAPTHSHSGASDEGYTGGKVKVYGPNMEILVSKSHCYLETRSSGLEKN